MKERREMFYFDYLESNLWEFETISYCFVSSFSGILKEDKSFQTLY